ncbi:MAG: OmpH family outer membrane protein, partial [Flavobacteriales bacterium]|nr:OmpH family outer membrane protein [Flavobacteriales bacterium]
MKKFLVVIFLTWASMANAQKFAYVDTDYILANLPEYSSAQKQINDISIKWQKEIEDKLAEVDKMYKDYQVEKILMTEEMRIKKEEDIINKEKEAKELQKKRFGQNGDLFKKQQELIKPIQDKVYNAVVE